jgi:hypothetical protein
MAKSRRNSSRERRIEQEIVVDAYTPEECATSWFYYLEDKLKFPFKAKCIARRSISPLKIGEEVQVLSLAKEEDCRAEIFVLIRFAGRNLGVPLAQLEVAVGSAEMCHAVEDWRYWVALGYKF